jgi:surface antigen
LIIFKNGGRSHVGVVESIGADGRINTIEGNTSNKVARRSYSANDRTITGFAQIA